MSERLTRITNIPVVEKILGFEVGTRLEEYRRVVSEISPVLLRRERLIAQAAEIQLISGDADSLEHEFQKRDLPMPSAWSVLSLGHDELPEDAILIGKFGEGSLVGFPEPAAQGHAGELWAVKRGDKTFGFLKGRAHPNEWVGERFGNMIVAHPLRVVQELRRRRIAKDGVSIPVVLTYVTGVSRKCKMGAKGLGIIIDDMEGTNIMQPGFGGTEYLDGYVGPHFQPKMARTSADLARQYLEVAREKGVKEVYPVAALGTSGTPEYQSIFEAVFGEILLKGAKKAGLLKLANDIFYSKEGGLKRAILRRGQKLIGLLFDMGITFELATLRQTFYDEENADVLAIGLATDVVGGEQSMKINHPAVFAEAMTTRERNMDLLMTFLERVTAKPRIVANRKDYSIRHKLQLLEQ